VTGSSAAAITTSGLSAEVGVVMAVTLVGGGSRQAEVRRRVDVVVKRPVR